MLAGNPSAVVVKLNPFKLIAEANALITWLFMLTNMSVVAERLRSDMLGKLCLTYPFAVLKIDPSSGKFK